MSNRVYPFDPQKMFDVFMGKGLTPELLIRIGSLLFTERDWQESLSNALQINMRTIKRWIVGKAPIPESLREDLSELLLAQRTAVERRIERANEDDDLAPSYARLDAIQAILAELSAK